MSLQKDVILIINKTIYEKKENKMLEKTRISKLLKSKGFDVAEIDNNLLVASLNRSVHVNEIMTALDYSVEEFQLVNRRNGSIAIVVLDEMIQGENNV